MDHYAVIGNPISHSKSPLIHRLFAQQTAQQLCYEAILCELTEFPTHMQQLISQGLKGANITLPFKEQAFHFADSCSLQAQLAGAVNTFIITSTQECIGDNTDGVGLLRDLTVNRNISLRDRRILVLGAGGAARGIMLPLLEAQPAELVIANRTPERAQQLATLFQPYGPVSSCGFMAIPEGPFDIVINATSASLLRAMPELPLIRFTPTGGCYDLAYGIPDNAFLTWGKQAGAQWLADGLGMLVEQAAASFYRWRGIQPDTAPVLHQLRSHLS